MFTYLNTEFQNTCMSFSPTSAIPGTGYGTLITVPCGTFNNCQENSDTIDVPVLSAKEVPVVD